MFYFDPKDGVVKWNGENDPRSCSDLVLIQDQLRQIASVLSRMASALERLTPSPVSDEAIEAFRREKMKNALISKLEALREQHTQDLVRLDEEEEPSRYLDQLRPKRIGKIVGVAEALEVVRMFFEQEEGNAD